MKFYQFLVSTILALVGIVILGSVSSSVTGAVVNNTSPQAKVSFTFDDGLANSFTNAAPTLAKYGFSGTNYVITDCMGLTTVPNSCQADGDVSYMSWGQAHQLQDNFGWEIGSHTATHPLTSEVTSDQIEQEASRSKAALVAQGFSPTAFATPYGDYDHRVLSTFSKYYTSHRGFADIGYNNWPYGDHLLRVQQVQVGVSVDTVKGYVDQALADQVWLILVFHGIEASPSQDPGDYQYSTSDLDRIANYVKQTGIKVTNITEGLVSGGASDNLVTAPTDGQLIGTGWTTDSSSNIAPTTGVSGDVAIKLESNSSKSVHLFSPSVKVTADGKYVIKGYLTVDNPLSAGEVGFYIDEYDSKGNWISGQYLQTINSWYMRDIAITYTPSSDKVANSVLQLIINQDIGKISYLESLQWLMVAGSVNPAPAPDPTPSAALNNLMANGSFSDGLANWSTDSPNQITLDTTGKGSGSESVNSVRLTSKVTSNSHLFSSKLNVPSPITYTISANLNVVNIGAGIGFYIDEYDASGNWVSGQYVATKSDVTSGIINFSYKPSSTDVVKASLQVIVIASSNTVVYIDDVQWVDPSSPATPSEPDPTPTPIPALSNLVANGDFGNGLTNWSTDSPSQITLDTTGKGSGNESVNSVKLTSKISGNSHLFSDQVGVSSAAGYALSLTLNISNIGSGIGIYVDEYDAKGNWVSGQYVTTIKDIASGTISFSYKPSSVAVVKASLQVIVLAGSNTRVYIDDVKWVIV